MFPPRGPLHHEPRGVLAYIGPFFSKRAIQVYCVIFVFSFVSVLRNQWMYGLPPVGSNAVAMNDMNLRRGSQALGFRDPLQTGITGGASIRLQEKPAPASDATERRAAEITADGQQGAESYLIPRSQEVLEGIYARGRKKIKAELDRRGNNLTAIEPFNPWGPVYIWDWFSPDFNCPTMERIGRVGDGGKWICGVDVLKPPRKCLVYSYGVNRDLSFELELIGRTGCEVHAFDPTVGGTPPDCKGNPHITFHKQALGPKTGPTNVFMLMETLLDTMKKQGHTFIDVLKVDIEGSEWETFKSMLPEKALPFGQLLIELHFSDTYDVFNFFENMETHGFKIFSRETNHNPCAAGKLPIAVEFSLINPAAYFSGRPDAEAVKAVVSRPTPPTYNGVIYTLTRHANMKRLTNMLSNLEKNYVGQYHYPVVIFHDDLTETDKAELRTLVPRTTLDFRFVEFTIPEWLDKSKIPERTPCSPHSSTVGYRHMNRFLAYYASKQLADEFEWQWRLDDDSVISEEVGYDIFHLMAVNKKRYGYTNIVQDDDLCVVGLWDAVKTYIDQNRLDTTFFTRWRDGAVFYNNFEVSHRSVWTSKPYVDYFNYIDQLGGIYYHRWGDAPIRSIGVSLFVDEHEVHQFTDVAYTHLPFIDRKATGLPSPSHGLFHRDFNSANTCFGGGHGGDANATLNGTTNGTSLCGLAAKPAAVIFTVLDSGINDIDNLMIMLQSLDKNFNNRSQYPVIVMGYDLTVSQRVAIRKSTTSKVEFMDLGWLAKQELPSYMDEERIPETVDCGFGTDTVTDRKRYRWLAYDGMKRLGKEYDWVWRIAYDAVFTEEIKYDPFALMASQGKTYGYVTTMHDDIRCVPTLWESTNRYVKQNNLKPTFLDLMPVNTVFYNGFEISHRSLWDNDQYQDFFTYMDKQGGFLYERWTDSNLHTLAVSLFVDPNRMHRFSDMGLKHWPFLDQHSSPKAIKRDVKSKWEGHALSVTLADDLNPLLAPRRWGYIGADVATSFRLPSTASGLGSYMWLLGDTFIGTADANRRLNADATIHNSLAFMPKGQHLSSADVRFFWNLGSDGVPQDVFPHPKEDGIYWPVAGISSEIELRDGSKQARIILLVQRIIKTHDLADFLVAGMNFQVEGTSVIVVDNPEDSPSTWRYRVGDVPETDGETNWFSAIALASGKEVATSQDDVVYLVGNVGTRGMGIYDKGSKTVLGRIKLSSLLDLQLDQIASLVDTDVDARKGVWRKQASPSSRLAITKPANPEFSLQYSSALRRWYAMEVEAVTAQLVLWTARDPWGEWEATVVHNIEAPYDDLDRYRCYAGKGHPEFGRDLTNEVELVFSYVCNAPNEARLLFEDDQLALYTPRFVRVRLTKPRQEADDDDDLLAETRA